MNTLLQKFIDKSIIIQCYYIFFLQRMRVIFDLTFHPKTINNITTLRQPNCKDDIRYSFRSSRYIFFPCLSSIYSMTFIKNNFIEIEFIHHTIRPCKVCSSIVFTVFTELGNHHRGQFQNIFITPERNPIPTCSHCLFLPCIPSLRQPLVYFLSLWSFLFWIFYHTHRFTICSPWCLASFTQHNVLLVFKL